MISRAASSAACSTRSSAEPRLPGGHCAPPAPRLPTIPRSRTDRSPRRLRAPFRHRPGPSTEGREYARLLLPSAPARDMLKMRRDANASGRVRSPVPGGAGRASGTFAARRRTPTTTIIKRTRP
ncbi:hypothetical protein OF001_U90004 [Pseudomonas sp. OF001]|nr:hypothetical protein OF001_U90004 [Pseudomonas sp. OF001]